MTDEGNVRTSSEDVLTNTAEGISTSVGNAADEAMKAVRDVSDKAMKAVEEAADEAMKSCTQSGQSALEEVSDIPEDAFADESQDIKAVAAETTDPKEEPVVSPLPDNGSPVEPPKKSRTGIIIGILIALAAAAVIGILLYMKFFIPKEIHVSESALDLYVGDSAHLTYQILPESADNLEVAWASSDPEVATVDELGVVNALSGGRCVIAVATGNGKTATCVVTVTDPAQVQKESLMAVKDYIDANETTDEDGKAVMTVREIDDSHSFLIGADDEDLYLIYRTVGEMEELGVDAQYSTYVRMSPENIETAEVSQRDVLSLYGFDIEMTDKGTLNLGSYQYGDAIALSETASSIDGLDATDALHELTNAGTGVCLNEFDRFLKEQNFDFTTEEFGLTSFTALVGAADETAASDAQPAEAADIESGVDEAAVESEAVSDENAAESEAASDENAAESEAVSDETAAEGEDISDEAAAESDVVSEENETESEAVSEEAVLSEADTALSETDEAVSEADDITSEETERALSEASPESTGETGETDALSETSSAAVQAEEERAVTDSTESAESDAVISDDQEENAAAHETAETESTSGSVFSEFPTAGPTSVAFSFAAAAEELSKTPPALIVVI